MGERVVKKQAVKILIAEAVAKEGLVDRVCSILRGIEDEDNVVFHIDETDGTVDESGWWETAEGAEFGARKLKEVVDLVSEAERQLAEKDEYHEAYKEEYLDTLKELCELCTEKDAEIRMWKERVIEWQDVDSSNQDEIERLRDIAYPPGY